eukprot:TRINITY_DN1051_c0_g1_i1.p1 TRINITY_DN1051_c0_g1~~TRINITY_DN1051_c0_g1_i1.p1  ORF type:complete len:328 (-),score=65.32 TRINITY_DN1051_c0_g1_i1:32-1015(-)
MTGFDTYDWNADSKWKSYLDSITISSDNEQQAIAKLKRKYYKRHIDPEFDDTFPSRSTHSTSSETKPNPPSSSSSSTSSASTNNTTPRTTSNNSSASSSPSSSPYSLFSLTNIWTIAHCYLLVNSILYLVSFSDSSLSAYRRALLSGCVAYGSAIFKIFSVSSNTGGTRVKDYVYYLLYCASLLCAQPTLFYLVPLVICSFFLVGDKITGFVARIPILNMLNRFLLKGFSYQQQAQGLVAQTEIMAFLSSIVQVITGYASLIVPIVLWQFVTYKYHTSPATKIIAEGFANKVDSVLQHRFVPGAARNMFAVLRNSFGNYAQYDKPRM